MTIESDKNDSLEFQAIAEQRMSAMRCTNRHSTLSKKDLKAGEVYRKLFRTHVESIVSQKVARKECSSKCAKYILEHVHCVLPFATAYMISCCCTDVNKQYKVASATSFRCAFFYTSTMIGVYKERVLRKKKKQQQLSGKLDLS